MKILIACGGTGGHLFPGIAVAEALLAQGHEPLLLISQKKIDSQASAKYPHLNFKIVPAIAKPATLSPKMIPFLWALHQSIQASKKIIREFGADAVLGMGGFTSLPPVYAGYKLGKKTFVHDSNARPGRANVLTSRFCDKVFIGLQPAAAFFKKPTLLTGTPARPEIHKLPSRTEAAERFGLDPAKPTLLVTGGSQGALGLNQLVANAAPLLPENIQILHIAGPNDLPRASVDSSPLSLRRGRPPDRQRESLLGSRCREAHPAKRPHPGIARQAPHRTPHQPRRPQAHVRGLPLSRHPRCRGKSHHLNHEEPRQLMQREEWLIPVCHTPPLRHPPCTPSLKPVKKKLLGNRRHT